MNYTDILKYSALFVISFIVFYFIYWNIAKHNIIQYYYYSIHNKFFDIFTEKSDYYNIFLVLSFSFIVIIITIVLYWTILYNTAKKKSNCAEIFTIIEENAVSESPYVYTFAIIDKNSIEDKLSYFLLKIRYDFNTRSTKIEYGKDLNGENKLFDKLLLDYERKLFLRAGDKINEDNIVFKDTNDGKELQEKIVSIVEKITIDNYADKLDKIIDPALLFNKIFTSLDLSGSADDFTTSMSEQIKEIRVNKIKLDENLNKVFVKSWKPLPITDNDITKHTQTHIHKHKHERYTTHTHALLGPHDYQKGKTHGTRLPHTHYISDLQYKEANDHDADYNIHDNVNIAILTARGYTTDCTENDKPMGYYKNQIFDKNSYIIVDEKYYVPDDTEAVIDNNTLDKINETLKEIFDFLLDYLELQLNYPLESVDKYFEMKSRKTNDKKLRYYDLSSMKIKIIDGVYIDKINNEFFKIVSVDKHNKIHKTYTSMKLLDFTRYNATHKKIEGKDDYSLYSSDTIIYNIIYANKNKDKISL